MFIVADWFPPRSGIVSIGIIFNLVHTLPETLGALAKAFLSLGIFLLSQERKDGKNDAKESVVLGPNMGDVFSGL